MKDWKQDKDVIYDVVTLLRQRSHGNEIESGHQFLELLRIPFENGTNQKDLKIAGMEVLKNISKRIIVVLND